MQHTGYGNGGRGRKSVTLKVILLGDSGVGKTSLMRQYVTHKFEQRFKATIGADFFSKEVIVEDTPVSLHIWDTAGQERFQSLGTAFYRGADVCLLVFDISNASSFNNLQSWMQEFRLQAGDSKEIMLVGNKADLKDAQQAVFLRSIKDFCQQGGADSNLPIIRYFEVSAKANTSVEDLFEAAASTAFQQRRAEHKAAEEAGGGPGGSMGAGSVTMSKRGSGGGPGKDGRGAVQGSKRKKDKCNC
jgi:Ras-related protein Rab-7A